MKIFTHRGWTEGSGENTISAFQKSIDVGADGVELDIRRGIDGKGVVVSHDAPLDASALNLEEALRFLKSSSLELLIELKEYDDEFFELVIEMLRQYGLCERSTVFAFPEIAQFFPWETQRDVKFGIIAPYPQHIKKCIKRHNPDVILFGWGNKKERMMFKIFWRIFSLPKICKKHSPIKFVAGVAYDNEDKKWLSQQGCLHGITINMPT